MPAMNGGLVDREVTASAAMATENRRQRTACVEIGVDHGHNCSRSRLNPVQSIGWSPNVNDPKVDPPYVFDSQGVGAQSGACNSITTVSSIATD
jgi:hypothetical protein